MRESGAQRWRPTSSLRSPTASSANTKLSYRAKGVFGYVSTHRNGWQVTITDLAAVGPDGKEAVRVALRELERCGYLIRERLRRVDGTLGEIVYSITDHPATLDADLSQALPGVAVPAAGDGSGFPGGIRRGVMAADQFTQIANGLFRDYRLSFKAKGLFGLISTHRDGWRMTVADLARRGRDGEAAVRSGLKELEKHGFLLREPARPRRHPRRGRVLHHRPTCPAKQQVTTRIWLSTSGYTNVG